MKASVYIAATVDGFIATPDGDVGFLDEYHGAPSTKDEPQKANKYDFDSFMKSVDVVIFGRKSFEKVLSFGPEMWAYGKTKVVVLTRQNSLEIPSHLKEQATWTAKRPQELLSQLSAEGYEHAYIDGGQTIQSFLSAKLVNQLILTRVPLLLGQGIPLFDHQSSASIKLDHQETVDLGNGLITSCYNVLSDHN
eukprot:CAMPEP_0172458786 /NCGR_PEP_ID=MMETSP1065-20121228/29304_1 /TAXON_ID=265537 /ORGANISM="Amphiprora paludosa, Strain CCMP125" /LENGTH=192 /DNA_ID=CAMNT_0013213197 /DNA_START=89 /DNA_END=667 /DNA_ORIENTATION=+